MSGGSGFFTNLLAQNAVFQNASVSNDATQGTQIVNYRTMVAYGGGGGGGGTVTEVSAVGGGVSLLQAGLSDVGPVVETKTLVAGANITITPGADTITITGAAGGGGGTVTEVSSVGGGVSLLQGGASDVGPIVETKSLIAGTNITLTPALDTITISAAGGGGGTVTEVSSVGGGLSLLQGGASDVGPIVETKSLIAGTNITLTPGADTITISAGGGGGGTLTQLTAVGGGASLLQSGLSDVGPVVETKTLVAGANITITPALDTITISAAGGGGGAPPTAAGVNFIYYERTGSFVRLAADPAVVAFNNDLGSNPGTVFSVNMAMDQFTINESGFYAFTGSARFLQVDNTQEGTAEVFLNGNPGGNVKPGGTLYHLVGVKETKAGIAGVPVFCNLSGTNYVQAGTTFTYEHYNNFNVGGLTLSSVIFSIVKLI